MSKKRKKPMRSFEESVRAGAPVFAADALRRGLGGIGAVLKKPLMLLPAVILLLVQTALSLIKISAPNSAVVQILSLLTFAQGGMYAGFFGKLGGVVGKALLAGMLTKLFIKNKGQKPPKREKPRGGSFVLLIPGIGAGLIAYNFLTGNACLENAMIGVTSAISVFRTAGKPDAFLPGLLRSFRKGKTPAGAARSVLLGGGAGLVLGVLTSLRGGGYLCYALGAALLIIGLVLMIVTKNKRAAVAAAALLLCLSPLAGLATTAQAAGDSLTLTLESLQDNVFYPQIVYSRPQVTLVPGKNASMKMGSPDDPLSENELNATLYRDFAYTFDFIWQGNDIWKCESSMYCRYVRDGELFEEVICAKENANVTIDKSLIGSEIVIPIACITANDLPDSWLETGIGMFFAQTQTATFTVSADAAGTAPTGGTWKYQGMVPHNWPIIMGAKPNEPFIDSTAAGNAVLSWTYMPDKANNNTKVGAEVWVHYPTSVAPGELISVQLMANFHQAAIATTWAGIDSCGKEQHEFPQTDLVERYLGTDRHKDNVPELLLTTEDGYSEISCANWRTTQAQFDALPDSYDIYAVERTETVSAVMPDTSAFGDRCSLYVGIRNSATADNPSPMIEIVYQWVPNTPLPPGGGEDDPSEGDDPDPLYDEDGFFDGENWLDYDELYEHTDTGETIVTDAAAAAGGLLAALLAAGGIIGGGLGGFPPLPDSPYIKRDPDDPSYATLTGPGGEQSLYRYDESSGLWRDPYSDSYLEPGQIDRAMRDARSDREFSESVIKQMEDRTDAASKWQKQLFKMEQQEERLWKTGGTYGGTMEKHLADQLKKLRHEMMGGGELNVAQYEKVRNAVGKISRGEMLDDSHMVAAPSDKWTVGEIAEGLALTGREIGTSSSWKAWALRGLMAVGTGGASEKAFDLSDALYTMHDSYMAGDSEGTAFAKAVGGYVAGELAGEAVKTGLKAAKKGLKAAGGAVADSKAGQKMLGYVKELIDPAAKQADDAAKAAKKLAMAGKTPAAAGGIPELKTAKPGGEVGAAPKPASKPKPGLETPKPASKPKLELETSKPKSKASFDSLQDDKRVDLLKKDAQEDMQKKLDDLRKKQGADRLQDAANERAAGKVKQLQDALDELKKDPDNPAKRRAAEEAAMLVQQDKAGIRQMKQSGNVSSESRQIFNALKTQKDQIATANTREILAKKFGVDPGQVKSIEPSNTMTTSELRKVGEADGIYKEAAAGSTDGAKRFTEKDFPLDPEKASKTGVSSDIDKTMRIEIEELDPKTGKTVVKKYDVPSGELKTVYEEEFYRSWHDGKIPTKTVNGKTVTDTEAIERFAKEMDVSCNDKISTESYSDLVEAIKKDGVKDFSDVEATGLTTAHKSTEWFQRADILEKNAGGDLDILAQAENLRAEGIRQATKQFDNLTMRQAREINLARNIDRAKVPDTLIQRMEVLKRIDKIPPDGISTSEAEAILKQMGTDTERTLEQFYAVTEMLNKWK